MTGQEAEWLQWVGIVIAPIGILIVATFLRAIRYGGIPPSAGADWILTLLALDASLLLEAARFSQLVKVSWIGGRFVDYVIALAIANAIAWIFCALLLEPVLVRASSQGATATITPVANGTLFHRLTRGVCRFVRGSLNITTMATTWMLCVAATVAHVYPFVRSE